MTSIIHISSRSLVSLVFSLSRLLQLTNDPSSASCNSFQDRNFPLYETHPSYGLWAIATRHKSNSSLNINLLKDIRVSWWCTSNFSPQRSVRWTFQGPLCQSINLPLISVCHVWATGSFCEEKSFKCCKKLFRMKKFKKE